MMGKIIRTPTRAEGGITPQEKIKLDEIVQKWIRIAYQTQPIDRQRITEAIKQLYRVSGLAEPQIIIVSSPYMMALVYGLAAGIWWLRYHVTDQATDQTIRQATDWAIHQATDQATDWAIHQATDQATEKDNWLYNLALHFGGTKEKANFMISCIENWNYSYQGGSNC